MHNFYLDCKLHILKTTKELRIALNCFYKGVNRLKD